VSGAFAQALPFVSRRKTTARPARGWGGAWFPEARIRRGEGTRSCLPPPGPARLAPSRALALWRTTGGSNGPAAGVSKRPQPVLYPFGPIRSRRRLTRSSIDARGASDSQDIRACRVRCIAGFLRRLTWCKAGNLVGADVAVDVHEIVAHVGTPLWGRCPLPRGC